MTAGATPNGPGADGPATTGPATNAAAALRRAVADRAGRVDLLVLHVGEERFAVPLAASVEVVRLAGTAAVARLAGVPVVDAGAQFGVRGAGAPRAAAIVRAGAGVLALAVDAAVPVHGADLAGVRGVPWPDDGALLGVLPRGDTVVALVDVDALASLVVARAPSSELDSPLRPVRA